LTAPLIEALDVVALERQVQDHARNHGTGTDTRLDAGHLDELISRAEGQADQLEELRIRAAKRVIMLPDR
jgi:hypothetical protein